MSMLFLLFVFFENTLFIESKVKLYKNNFLSTPNSASFELKCDFELEKDKQFVQKVDISKDEKVFFSIEYSHGNAAHNGRTGLPPHIIPVTYFKQVSGIRELQTNDSIIDSNRNKGWATVHVKRGKSLIPGKYSCTVHYLEESKHSEIASNKVHVESKKEEVKFKINGGHDKFRRNKDIKMECKYKLLKKDRFAGLSLVKDSQEFFRFFNTNNHSFVAINGIPHIKWSSSAKVVRLTILKAQNATGGTYKCLFNYSNPDVEQKVVTLTDMSRIMYKNSKDNKLSNTWILLLLTLIYINY